MKTLFSLLLMLTSWTALADTIPSKEGEGTILQGYTCDVVLRYTIDSNEDNGRENIGLALELTADHTPTYILAGELHKESVRFPVTGHTEEGGKTVIHATGHKLSLPRVGGQWNVWVSFSIDNSSGFGYLYAHGLTDNGRFSLSGFCKSDE